MFCYIYTTKYIYHYITVLINLDIVNLFTIENKRYLNMKRSLNLPTLSRLWYQYDLCTTFSVLYAILYCRLYLVMCINILSSNL